MDKVTVSANALRQLLAALSGPEHYIRELQVTRGPLVGDDNPINILVAEYNAEWARYQKPMMPNDGVGARREVGKWLNEETGALLVREAAAELCAAFDQQEAKIERLQNGVMLAIAAHKTGGLDQAELAALESMAPND